MPAAIAVPIATSVISTGVGMYEANKSKQQANDQYNQSIAQAQEQTAMEKAAAAPYIQSGQAAAQQLNEGTAPGGSLVRQLAPADYARTPAEMSVMDAARKAIGNSASARGGSLSGMAVSDQMKMAANFAGNDINNLTAQFANNQKQQMGGLMEIAGMGSRAVESVGKFGTENNAQMMGMRNNMAYTDASANMANAKYLTGGISTIGNSINDYLKGRQPQVPQPQVPQPQVPQPEGTSPITPFPQAMGSPGGLMGEGALAQPAMGSMGGGYPTMNNPYNMQWNDNS